jgi:BirA family biotin operon repressor/biotin-[acetyl-CoA-carboxylase] ligase
MPTPSSTDRRARVLAALRARPAGVSGEEIAGELGVSRVAVGKHVSALRELGYEIEAGPGRGYRLVNVPDAPLPYEVAPLLTSRFWGPLSGGGVTASTNDDARVLARAGALEGAVVLASAQTAGRGRLGRAWESPAGGVYLSALLRPGLAPSEAGPLPLVVGLGVAIGLERLGARVALKWPNDVLSLDASGAIVGKVAGVLLESLAEGERLSWVVAGVGVDVSPPKDPASGGAYLDTMLGRRVGSAAAAAAVLDGIAEAYGSYVVEGFGTLRVAYEKRTALNGAEVEVTGSRGDRVAAGVVAGVDDSGRLVVDCADGPRSVSAGDVTLRR